MFLSVSHLVEPNASDPSLIPFGTAFNPSSVATITTGTVKRAKVKEAHKIPPVPNVGDGKASEKILKIIKKNLWKNSL